MQLEGGCGLSDRPANDPQIHGYQWFSTRAVLPPGDIRQVLEMLFSLQMGGCYRHLRVEARNHAKPPAAQDGYSIGWLQQRILWPQMLTGLKL